MTIPEGPDGIPRPRLLVMQIIAGSLVTGVLLFLAIAVVMVQQRGGGLGQAGAVPIISYLALAMIVATLVGRAVVVRVVTAGQVAQIAKGNWQPPAQAAGIAWNDRLRLLAVYQTQMIVGGALMEGPAFLGTIAFLLEGQWFALIATAVGVGMILATFPTQSRVEGWVEVQNGRVQEIRHTGGG